MRILILSIGTGTLFSKSQSDQIKDETERNGEHAGDTLKRAIIAEQAKQKEFAYRTSTYRFKGDEKLYRSPFVAEALIDKYDPDKIVVIGTVKSCWSSFYACFADKRNDVDEDILIELFQSEDKNGLDASMEKRNKIECLIATRFREKLSLGKSDRNVEIIPIVIPYGIADDDPEEIYRKLSTTIGSLIGEGDVDIAFDITHSFRSMPIYNLVILNYYANLLNHNINISHVYYGNLDISSENGNIAEIMDLSELVNVMDLTNCVSQFRKTGNSLELSKMTDDNELKDALQYFDVAIHMNDFGKINDAIQKIYKASEESNNNESRIADLKIMIREAINQGLFGHSKLSIENWNTQKYWDKQYYIGKWCLEQGRYGQAVAIGMESLRSYLLSIYKKNGELQFKGDELLLTNENLRKETTQKLQRLKISDKGMTESEKILSDLQHCYENCRPIRNNFAHNLDGDDKDLDESIKLIKELYDTLDRLQRALNRDDTYEDLVSLYNKKGEGKKKTKEVPVRVFITNKKDISERIKKYYKKSGDIKYDLYRIDEEIINYIRKDIKNNNDMESSNAMMIYENLNLQGVFDNEASEVICLDLSLRQKLFYYPLLTRLLKNNIIFDVPKGKIAGSKCPKNKNLGKAIDELIDEGIILTQKQEELKLKELVNVDVDEKQHDCSKEIKSPKPKKTKSNKRPKKKEGFNQMEEAFKKAGLVD